MAEFFVFFSSLCFVLSIIRTLAIITGYDFVTPEHIMTVITPICLHRLTLRDPSHFTSDPDLFKARTSFKEIDLIVKALDNVKIPI